MKILVVGAGPTGLTAALELARRGVTPVIVDRRDELSSLSRAVGITPRSLELLSHCGVAKRLIAEGVPMTGLEIYRADQHALSIPLHSDRAFFRTILGLPQDRTEAAMADVLSSLGGEVRYGLSVTEIVEDGPQVVARFSDDTEDVFDHLIGADGARSTVREQSGIDYPGFDLDQTWSIADVDAANWRHPDKITLALVEPGTVMVIAPMAPSRYRLVASHENALHALPLPMEVTRVRRESTFSIAVRQADTYSTGRVHLAGDAAHCHAPVGGRGMNLGIADAADLAERIVEGGLDEYTSVRHKEGRDAIATTERGRKMTAGTDWQRRLALRTLLGLVDTVPPAARRLGQFLVEF